MEIDYGTTVCNMEWSNNTTNGQMNELAVLMYDDVFYLPTHQPAPLDFSVDETSGGYDDFQLQNYRVVDVPLLDEMFLNHNFYTSSPDLAQNHADFVVPGFWIDDEDPNQVVASCNNKGHWALEMKTEKMKVVAGKKRKAVNYKSSTAMMSSKNLSWETVSKYFYMPITEAARELNVGLTLLKKRCRELGIRRWPHRKLNSLQTLIKNVQEFGTEGSSGDEGRLKVNLQVLEQEMKLLEEIPDMQLGHTTKRLRQAYFKASYKKRKLMGLVDSPSSVQSESPTKYFGTTTKSPATAIADHENADVNYCGVDGDDDDEDLELKYLLAGCFSCNEDSLSVLKMIS